ncbi:Multifunctional CCA protein [Dirofilaria immitis]
MFIVAFFIFTICNAIWIGEEYWTTIGKDGSLLGDRTIKDFLTFHITYFTKFTITRRAYIAFWVMYDEFGHYETFGHAYLVQNGVCARFVDRYHKAKITCGGFRVLSRSNNNGNLAFKFVQSGHANIHDAVEYRSRQVAKIVNWAKNEAWYGNAFIREAFAEGIDNENAYIKISYVDDPFFYQRNVYILVNCDPNDPEAGKSEDYIFYHTPKEENRLIDHNQQLQFYQQYQRVEILSILSIILTSFHNSTIKHAFITTCDMHNANFISMQVL